jgi:hypothetical protein
LLKESNKTWITISSSKELINNPTINLVGFLFFYIFILYE